MPQTAARKNNAGFTLVEIMIVVLIIGILLAIAIPSFVKARDKSYRTTCVSSLTKMQDAKEEFAIEHKKANDYTVQINDITPYLKSIPVCPAGGVYDLLTVQEQADCSFAGHDL